MKTYSLRYSTTSKLETFINKNSIANSKEILLQIFSGVCDSEVIYQLIQDIKRLIPHIQIVGTTTDGEILSANILENSIVLSFTIFQNSRVVTHFIENEQNSYESAKKLIKKFDKTKRAKVAISFTDGLHTNGEEYIRAFSEYDNELVIAGGLAGDNSSFKETIVFTQDKILTNGSVVALIYSDNLYINTQANFGWSKIGKRLTITKSKENIVYEIDGIKAYEIYKKYLGKDIAKELPSTGIEFPLIINRDGMQIARAVIGRGEDGSLIFAGNLNVGDVVTFGYGNIETILDGGYEICKSLDHNPSESIFIYSCMARKALMGKNIKEELEELEKIAPTVGFFTYGEFFKNSNHSELLNQTMTILSLSENSSIKSRDIKVDRKKTTSNKTLKALSHLIMQTSYELEKINEEQERKIQIEVEKNRQKDRQLFQQSRLAQMGEMISMIAHQWRQPLAAIAATTNNLSFKLMMDDFNKDIFEEEIENISSYTQHLSKTIDDFRSFFKEDKESKRVFLKDIVEDTLTISKVSLENKNIELNVEFRDDCLIETYPNEVKQVILNLIKNAEDVLLDQKIKKPKIDIKVYQEHDLNIISVHDNGGGIPDDILERIFEPYFSTKLEKDGTGLGLYMSKTMIEDHCNGKLYVENLGDGALFKIELKSLNINKTKKEEKLYENEYA